MPNPRRREPRGDEGVCRRRGGLFGLACVGYRTVKPLLDKHKLVRVLSDWTPAFPGLRLYYPGHRHIPAGLRALVGVIRESGAAV